MSKPLQLPTPDEVPTVQEHLTHIHDEIDKMTLIRNAIKTPDGTVLESLHRHDYREHLDTISNRLYMVDGGLDYLRRSAHGDEIELSLTTEEPHSVQRRFLKWGTYGKSGKDRLKYLPIAEMETDHILAVLRECQTSEVLASCMRKELSYRSAGIAETGIG